MEISCRRRRRRYCWSGKNSKDGAGCYFLRGVSAIGVGPFYPTCFVSQVSSSCKKCFIIISSININLREETIDISINQIYQIDIKKEGVTDLKTAWVSEWLTDRVNKEVGYRDAPHLKVMHNFCSPWMST